MKIGVDTCQLRRIHKLHTKLPWTKLTFGKLALEAQRSHNLQKFQSIERQHLDALDAVSSCSGQIQIKGANEGEAGNSACQRLCKTLMHAFAKSLKTQHLKWLQKCADQFRMVQDIALVSARCRNAAG